MIYIGYCRVLIDIAECSLAFRIFDEILLDTSGPYAG